MWCISTGYSKKYVSEIIEHSYYKPKNDIFLFIWIFDNKHKNSIIAKLFGCFWKWITLMSLKYFEDIFTIVKLRLSITFFYLFVSRNNNSIMNDLKGYPVLQ